MAGNETEAAKPDPAAGKDDSSKDKAEEEKLPPLSAKDFKIYNSLAETMDHFVRATPTSTTSTTSTIKSQLTPHLP